MIIIFIILLILVLIIIFLLNKNENYDNIYYTNKFKNNLFVSPTTKIKNLEEIKTDIYFNSDIVFNKLVCKNINNQAQCWENNNCEWVNKFNNSYCTLAPKYF